MPLTIGDRTSAQRRIRLGSFGALRWGLLPTESRPSVVATLGVIPTRRMLGDGVQLESDHGRPVAAGEAIVIPTFHPASLHWRTGRRASAVDDLRRAADLARAIAQSAGE